MIQGYKLIEGWNKVTTQTGTTASKVYLVGVTLTDVDLEDIPNVGDPWSSASSDASLTCKSISITYLPDCSTATKYTCNFDTTPFIAYSTPISLDACSKSCSVGMEVTSWEPTSSSWKWEEDDKNVAQPLFRLACISNVTIEKVVNNFNNYMKTCMTVAGKVNSGSYLGQPKGCVLFMGADMNEFIDSSGVRRWKAQLHFAIKNITSDYNTGEEWQKVLNAKTGKWGQPTLGAGTNTYLYDTDSFSSLEASF